MTFLNVTDFYVRYSVYKVHSILISSVIPSSRFHVHETKHPRLRFGTSDNGIKIYNLYNNEWYGGAIKPLRFVNILIWN
jgi:hypothetical protein